MKKVFLRTISLIMCLIMILSCNLMANAAMVTDTNNTIIEDNEFTILYPVNITEDTEDFIVPITDARTRSIYHLNVSLIGNKTANTVTATVKNDFALGFSTVSITLKLYSYRTSAVLRASKYDNDLNLGESMSVTVSTNNQTAKYYAVLTGTGNSENINYSTYKVPFNKRGEKYPTDIVSPVTNQSLPYNFSVTATEIPSSQWVPWNATNRNQYAAHIGKDLTGYEVHHILPRRYGGTNAYGNLIALTKSDHTRVTNWWNYYK